MLSLRKASERGVTEFDWLKSYHSFSFGEYFDPSNMGFSSLRVINDDYIAPGGGFPTHGHRDMEIITYMLEGELAHKDGIGNVETIKAGEVQRMTAGKGILHSEFNYSNENPVRLLQIWLLPSEERLKPGYDQKVFSSDEKRGTLKLIVSRDGREDSMRINQDANIYASIIGNKDEIVFHPAPTRHLWLQVARGNLEVNGKAVNEGDGLAIMKEDKIAITTPKEAEFLLFDLT